VTRGAPFGATAGHWVPDPLTEGDEHPSCSTARVAPDAFWSTEELRLS